MNRCRITLVLALSLTVVILLGCALGRKKPAAPATVQEELNVVYGKAGGEELKLDLYAPKSGAGPFPALVLLHGGGWYTGSREQFRSAAAVYAQQGYVAVTVSYRFAPKHRFPAQIADAKCAVRWLRANAERYRIDTDHIGAVGGSAGGHLSLLLGLTTTDDGLEGDGGNAEQSSRVQVVVNLMGPTDLARDEWSPVTEKMILDLIGAGRDKAPEAYRKASPISYVRKDAPPILTIHGTADKLVPHAQAVRLHEALREVGAESQLETIEGGGHGDNLTGADVARMTRVGIDFLNKHLKTK